MASIKKRGDSWRARMWVTMPDGRRKQLTMTGTKDEARAWVAKRTMDQGQGVVVDSSRLTLGEYLDVWLETIRPTLADNTIVNRTTAIKNWKALMGGLKMDKVGPLQIQQAITMSSERGLAPGTVRTYYVILRTALRQAVIWKVIAGDPTFGVRMPRRGLDGLRCFTEEESVRFLDWVLRYTKHGPLCHLALASGCRMGELLALHWSDVDWKQGAIRVEASLTWAARKGAAHLKETKTRAGRRTILLDPGAMTTLTAHRKRQAAQRLRKGPDWQDEDLVFARRDGTFYQYRNIDSRMAYWCAQAGVPAIRFHDLRHTHATILLRRGRPLREVADRLGHSDPAVTLRTYAHVLPGDHEAAAMVVGDALRVTAPDGVPHPSRPRGGGRPRRSS